jgi:hypothetical protein
LPVICQQKQIYWQRVGGSKLLAKAGTGNGEKVVAKRGKADMAENSDNSTQTEKQRTTRTVKLTPEQALEILQQSLIECQKAGIDVRVVPDFYTSGQHFAGILLANVQVINGNLILSISEITGKAPES